MTRRAGDASAVMWVARVLPEASSHADWRRVRGYYRQQVEIIGRSPSRVPTELREGLADALLDVFASYSDCEQLMCEHAFAVLADIDGHERVDLARRRSYYEDDRLAAARSTDTGTGRIPGLMESIVETCRRRRDARSLREVFRGSKTSGLIIGSTAYGPFYNVRGNRGADNASDLDFIIVAETADALEEIARRLATLPFVCIADIEQFAYRARIFVRSLDNGRTVFSHKIHLWTSGMPDPMLPNSVAPAGYLLSLHVMTRSVLDHVLVSSTPRLLAEEAGTRRTVQDYREAPRDQQDHVRTFTGLDYHLDLATEPVEGGCIRSPRVYHIDEFGAYCPGFYQMMFMPEPILPWDDLGVRGALDKFRAKLAERLRYEADQRRYAMLRLSFAHVRRHVFAPQIIRRLDEGY